MPTSCLFRVCRSGSGGFGVFVGLGAFEAFDDDAGFDSFRRSPDALRFAVDDDADLLQVGFEPAGAAPRDLDTDAAEVLGFAAVGALTADAGATAGVSAFVGH